MKVWIVSSEYPDERAGGIARYVENIGRAFSEKGLDVTVITRAETDDHLQVADGFSIVGFTPRYKESSFKSRFAIFSRSSEFPYDGMAYWPSLSYQVSDVVQNLIKRLGPPDIIECQDYCGLAYFLVQKKLIGHSALQSIPILIQCHSPSFLISEANHQPTALFPDYWTGEMEKFCIAAADAVLSPSHFLAQQLLEKIPTRNGIEVIPLSNGTRKPSVFTTPSISTPTVLFFGRLEVRTGILRALQQMEGLWNNAENFNALLIGDDTNYSPKGISVGNYIRAHYSHRIRSGRLCILNNCLQEELKQHIINSYVVIAPSLWENIPNTCIEAMSLGQVVLASKQGGQVELIGNDRKNGFLFDWNLQNDFATKLSYLLKLSPSEKKVIGKNAQERVDQYGSAEKIIPRRIEHFQRIIQTHHKPNYFPVSWFGYHLPASLQSETSAIQNIPVFCINNENACANPKEALSNKKEVSNFSVIIPFYNLGKYIKNAVDSVLRSTLVPKEILIVDDCSTGPEDLAILEVLKTQYPSIRVLRHTVNSGLATARNTGVHEARGPFIAFLDADDEVMPDFFEKALSVLDAYPNVGFVYSWVQYFENSQGIWPTWNTHLPYILGHNMLCANCLVRREAFLAVGGNNPKFEYSLEDYECWINLVKHGWLGVSIPACLVRYRVRTGSMFRSATDNQFRYLYDLIIRTHPELYQQWGSELAQLQISNGSSIRWDYPGKRHSDPSILHSVTHNLTRFIYSWKLRAEKLIRIKK